MGVFLKNQSYDIFLRVYLNMSTNDTSTDDISTDDTSTTNISTDDTSTDDTSTDDISTNVLAEFYNIDPQYIDFL
jgi:zinc finger CCHC domain-containing protein 8